jgi:hypothetical protein
MKKIILFIVIALLFDNCLIAQEKLPSTGISSIVEVFSATPILAGVKEMKNFQIITDSGKTFIQANGVTAEGNFILFRREIMMTIDSNGSIVMNFLSLTESCSGVNCEKCSFGIDGGCKCEKVGSIQGGASYCNHTISRDKIVNDDLVVM